MGMSSALADQVVSQQGNFRNIVDAVDRVSGLSSHLNTLKNNQGNFNALYPASGQPNQNSSIVVEGASMTISQANQIVAQTRAASSNELTMGVGLDGTEASML